MFQIRHVLGSPYHPRGQSRIESSHIRLNDVMAALTMERKADWDLVSAFAQWSWRTAPKERLNGLTAYEVVTGLQPRNPLNNLVEGDTVVHRNVPEYVSNLVRQMRETYRIVQEGHRQVAEKLKAKGAQFYRGDPEGFDVGDFVLLRRPPDHIKRYIRKGQEETIVVDEMDESNDVMSPSFEASGRSMPKISRRLQPKSTLRIYQIARKITPSTYILMDPDTMSTDLGFGQPVSIERLIPVDLYPYSSPIGDGRVRISVAHRDGWRDGNVIKYGISGKIGVKFDGSDDLV